MSSAFSRYLQAAVVLLVLVGVLALALSGYLNTVIKVALDPLVGAQRWFSSRYMSFYEFLTVPRDVATLRQRNQELEGEISRLQTRVIELEQQLREAQVLYALLNFARTRPESTYIAASVIGRDPSPFLQYVIIDHGSDDGLRRGMPVVTEQGLVGRVDAVIAGAARVQLISDAASVVNVRLQSAQVDAVLSGSVTGDLTIEMIPQEVVIQPGDLVLTSGLGGSYPLDIVVGRVTSVRKFETDLFQTASVQPAVDFTSLRAVLVIVNFRPVDVAPLQPSR
ncbi:MAG: rod shape-determining protein MreC [Anaerolineae bacterium]|nr:rod shape-determining protein MreC [Anaerolineae bacterium]